MDALHQSLDKLPLPAKAAPSAYGIRVLKLGICIALPLVCFLLYWPACHFSFVNFDDPFFVTENLNVRSGINCHSFQYAFTNTLGFWQPLTWLSLILDASLSGTDPRIFHITNIWIHSFNSVLIYAIGLRLSRSIFWSGVVALLFACHPLNVESVAWISERKGLLAALFGLLSFWYYLNYVETGSHWAYGLVCLFFVMSLMSKTILLMFPVILIVADRFPLHRLDSTGAHNNTKRGLRADLEGIAAAAREKLPLFLITVLFLIVTIYTENEIGALKSSEKFPLLLRFQNALNASAWYLVSIVFPHNLSFFYPYPNRISPYVTFGLVLVFACVMLIITLLIRKMPQLAAGFSIWLLGIAPVVGVFQIGLHARADRYMYLPMVPLLALLVWGVRRCCINIKISRYIVIFVILGGISIESFSARASLQAWQSSKTLCEHALERDPDNFTAQVNLAQYLIIIGQYQQAIMLLDRASALNSDSWVVLHDKGFALTGIGKDREATRAYEEALNVDPTAVPTLLSLARLYVETKDEHLRSSAIALHWARRAVVMAPDSRETWQWLANCYVLNKQPQKALKIIKLAAERLSLMGDRSNRLEESPPRAQLQ